jgi:hypothetical protein
MPRNVAILFIILQLSERLDHSYRLLVPYDLSYSSQEYMQMHSKESEEDYIHKLSHLTIQ